MPWSVVRLTVGGAFLPDRCSNALYTQQELDATPNNLCSREENTEHKCLDYLTQPYSKHYQQPWASELLVEQIS